MPASIAGVTRSVLWVIVHIHYDTGKVFVRWALTHREYDKWNKRNRKGRV
jgi:mRNA-degrading endonuclease HigB of HigAB toxin-antitoxin module